MPTGTDNPQFGLLVCLERAPAEVELSSLVNHRHLPLPKSLSKRVVASIEFGVDLLVDSIDLRFESNEFLAKSDEALGSSGCKNGKFQYK